VTPTTRPVIAMAWPKPDYEAAVREAGGDVRVIAPQSDPLPGAIDGAAGVVLTGGVDVDPQHFGETAHPTVEIDATRDAYELALARFALDRDLPVLAICRGAQVLNVAAGGSLIQDIPSARPDALSHDVEPKTAVAHEVDVVPGSTLARLLARDLDASHRAAVNSRHHQAIARVAPGFVVSAVAPDGVIEAVEMPGACFCVAVQWHPENFWQSDRFGGLFRGLVAAAAARRAKG
jgi:putative glutamine amidotransferase